MYKKIKRPPWFNIVPYLVELAFLADVIRVWVEGAVVTCDVIPTPVVVVRHHQNVVHNTGGNKRHTCNTGLCVCVPCRGNKVGNL